MTDTSRTAADLKSRLPDNTDGEIVPQTARDIVESLAHPVTNGGLERVAYSPNLALEANWSGSQAIASGTPQTLVPALIADHDPAGMLQTGTYVSTMEPDPGTFGPRQWFRLPAPGLWIVHARVIWSNVTLGSFRSVGAGLIDDRGLLPNVDPFLHSPVLNQYWAHPGPTIPKAMLLPSGFHQTNFFIPVTEAMLAASDAGSASGAGWAVLTTVVLHDAGSPINITSVNVNVARIA